MSSNFGSSILIVRISARAWGMTGDFYLAACVSHILEMLPDTKLIDCSPAVCNSSTCTRPHDHLEDCDFCAVLTRVRAVMGEPVEIKREAFIKSVLQAARKAYSEYQSLSVPRDTN